MHIAGDKKTNRIDDREIHSRCEHKLRVSSSTRVERSVNNASQFYTRENSILPRHLRDLTRRNP